MVTASLDVRMIKHVEIGYCVTIMIENLFFTIETIVTHLFCIKDFFYTELSQYFCLLLFAFYYVKPFLTCNFWIYVFQGLPYQ